MSTPLPTTTCAASSALFTSAPATEFVIVYSKDKHNPDAETMSLHFDLIPHTVVDKFVHLIRQVKAGEYRIGYDSFSLFPDGTDPTPLIQQLQESIDFSNQSQCLDVTKHVHVITSTTTLLDSTVSLVDKMNHLNVIHSGFELTYNVIFQRRTDKSIETFDNRLVDDLNMHLNRVNNMVHALQALLNPGYQSQSASVLSNVCMTPVLPLDDEEYDMFTVERTFGDLFSSYGVLGKSLLHIATDNDIELLNQTGSDAPTPQNIVTSGWYVWGGRNLGLEEYDNFINWCEQNQIKQRWGIDPRDRKHATGYIKMGELQRQHYDIQGLNEEEILQKISQFTDCIDVQLI